MTVKKEVGKKQTFWQLITDEKFKIIKIPMIQRDYVQGRETPQIKFTRETLLLDLAMSLRNSKPVDLNFIYGNMEGDYFIPIDGQQRLTTLFLLHAYAFARDDLEDKLQILKDNFLYETRITTDRFLKALADNLPPFFKEKNYADLESYIYDAAWFSNNWVEDPSIYSAIVVLNEIDQKFRNIENLSQKLIQDDCPISFMALQIADMGKTNDLYIKMNSRGKILSYFESFKAGLFDFIDKQDCSKWPNFKQKIDNEWQNLIWEACRDNNMDPFKMCDTIFLYIIHWVVVNRIVPNSDNYNITRVNNVVNNNGFYNFDNYEEFLKEDTNINDIYQMFEFLMFLKENADDYFTQIIKWLVEVVQKPEWSERVLIFAITKYAITEKNWNVSNFLSYFRIINNLVQNTPIDKENLYKNACHSINGFSNLVFSDAESYFASKDDTITSKVISFFSGEQLKEERFKCSLIKTDYHWKDAIVNAERNRYFKGEIAFALKLTGANLDKCSEAKNIKIEDFKMVWHVISILFNDNGLTVNSDLFRRALLTFGDYSILANSSYTFFFEGGKGYFNWRRMLRDKSFSVFKKFFNTIKNTVKNDKELTNKLNSIIDDFNDDSNEFMYYLIKYPELFHYMNENRYIQCNSKDEKHRIILYSKSRLSAEYSEFHTYVLKAIFKNKIGYHFGRGYLDTDDSIAYIDQIGNRDCHIEYDNKFIDENGDPLINNNKEVITIKDGIEYIDRLIERV